MRKFYCAKLTFLMFSMYFKIYFYICEYLYSIFYVCLQMKYNLDGKVKSYRKYKASGNESFTAT